MNKLKSIVCVLLMMIILAGCNQKERLVYKSDFLTITRKGAHICVVDHTANRTFNYILRRVKRKQGGTVTAKTLIMTDSYKIVSAGGLWILELPTERTIIRW